MKGREYIQVITLILLILSLNKKILEGLKESIRNKKATKKIVAVMGKDTLICSFDAKVEI